MSNSSTSHDSHLRANQVGMVSIMVSMVLMLVISLIVLGFAQIARRNQRQALDQQLSTQAFYAAETGVNDARKLFRDALAAGNRIPEKTDCGAGSGPVAAFYGSLNPVIDTGVEYTCLLVDPSPTSLRYTIGSTSTIVPLQAESGNFSSLRLTWKTQENNPTPINNCPTNPAGSFTSAANWHCGYGVLRFDLVPTNGNNNIASLTDNVTTVFGVPLRTGGTNTVNFARGGGNVVGVRCSNTDCNLTVNGLDTNQYYLRISSIYKEAGLEITGAGGAGNVGLEGAQVQVDSTGKAQDVLRRIQVRVPIGPGRNDLPDYVMQSTDSVCKRFSVMSGFFQNDAAGVTSDSPLCRP